MKIEEMVFLDITEFLTQDKIKNNEIFFQDKIKNLNDKEKKLYIDTFKKNNFFYRLEAEKIEKKVSSHMLEYSNQENKQDRDLFINQKIELLPSWTHGAYKIIYNNKKELEEKKLRTLKDNWWEEIFTPNELMNLGKECHKILLDYSFLNSKKQKENQNPNIPNDNINVKKI